MFICFGQCFVFCIKLNVQKDATKVSTLTFPIECQNINVIYLYFNIIILYFK